MNGKTATLLNRWAGKLKKPSRGFKRTGERWGHLDA
jgi:hypothetical protein